MSVSNTTLGKKATWSSIANTLGKKVYDTVGTVVGVGKKVHGFVDRLAQSKLGTAVLDNVPGGGVVRKGINLTGKALDLIGGANEKLLGKKFGNSIEKLETPDIKAGQAFANANQPSESVNALAVTGEPPSGGLPRM